HWMVDELDYLDHFSEYYGDGWESFDRKRAVENFLDYATGTRLKPVEFIKYIASLDTTRGVPDDQQIVMTTVFREKGCEYDYIIIPDCIEGYMPCLRESGALVFDKTGQVEEPEPSEAIENERRLFYVALTRAKKAVHIGTVTLEANGSTPRKPSRFLDEIRHTPTVRVMEALQRLASGERQARAELLRWVQVYGGIRSISRALCAEYLRDLGDVELLGEVSRIVGSLPENPFGYRSSLTPPTTPKGDRALHAAWREVAV
ncbi:MAG: 3'-5' exonuclease, partial [bacterium]